MGFQGYVVHNLFSDSCPVSPYQSGQNFHTLSELLLTMSVCSWKKKPTYWKCSQRYSKILKTWFTTTYSNKLVSNLSWNWNRKFPLTPLHTICDLGVANLNQLHHAPVFATAPSVVQEWLNQEEEPETEPQSMIKMLWTSSASDVKHHRKSALKNTKPTPLRKIEHAKCQQRSSARTHTNDP